MLGRRGLEASINREERQKNPNSEEGRQSELIPQELFEIVRRLHGHIISDKVGNEHMTHIQEV
jgi:hypothetical protein